MPEVHAGEGFRACNPGSDVGRGLHATNVHTEDPRASDLQHHGGFMAPDPLRFGFENAGMLGPLIWQVFDSRNDMCVQGKMSFVIDKQRKMTKCRFDSTWGQKRTREGNR